MTTEPTTPALLPVKITTEGRRYVPCRHWRCQTYRAAVMLSTAGLVRAQPSRWPITCQKVAVAPRGVAEHVAAWPVDNAEAVAALTLYTGPVRDRGFDWFEAVGVVERIVREQIAAEFDRLSGNRNPHDPEGSRRLSDYHAHAADRIRHPEWFSGVAQAAGNDGADHA